MTTIIVYMPPTYGTAQYGTPTGWWPNWATSPTAPDPFSAGGNYWYDPLEPIRDEIAELKRLYKRCMVPLLILRAWLTEIERSRPADERPQASNDNLAPIRVAFARRTRRNPGHVNFRKLAA